VQYNWQRQADPATKSVNQGVAARIASMQVVDPLTLNVTLAAPDPNFNHLVSYQLATIGSPTAIKSEGAGFATKPVGAGPFILKEWVRGDHQTFVRNPDYWEKGRPYLDQIVHKFIADDLARYNTFKTTPGSMDFQFAYGRPEAKQDHVKTIVMTPNGGGSALAFNTTKPPFDDVRVRQAIAMAVDVNQFVQIRRNNDKALYMPTLDKAGTPFYDKNIGPPKPNIPAAQKLIDSYVADHGGKPVEFTFAIFQTAYYSPDAQLLQQQIQRLKNVTMTIDIQANTLLIANFNSGNFQVYPNIPRWNEPAVDMVSTFKTGAASNYMRYSNPQVDAWLNQLQTSTDQKTRVQLVHQIEQQVLKDAPVAYYTRFASYTYLDDTVRGVKGYYDMRYLLDQVWISGKK
jgi:peptide/nickel transport system substrate-binding protein